MHELSSVSHPNHRIDEVKGVVTLRSGREIKPSAPNPEVEDPNVVELEPEDEAPKGGYSEKEYTPSFSTSIEKEEKNHQPDKNIRSAEASEGQHPSA